ncbi:hypothetical protein G7Y89_g13543 [Cudoniella acicularis]|uniref:Uncharacterized protein n=1 Tax=Cudoniella acicularis TaxID=354080 RepID=A0A8H4R9F2_9HELO|nr:hypothetical protein G7Y89_g13543 [Cudoniella acicularis]
MLWTSSIVVNSWLYIDGGEYYVQGATSYGNLILGLTNFKNEVLWWIPEISSFEAFGGQPYTATTNSIWSLKPDGNGAGTWSEKTSPSDTFWQSVTWPCYGSNAASSTNGYILGGYAQYGNTLGAITGMIELGFANSLSNSTNITTAGQYSSSGMSGDGAAQFVASFGETGILVLLSGKAPLSSFDTNSMLRPMSNITIYDPSSMLWYSQTATGDVPGSRCDICIVGAQSTNSSTFEIYSFVYGGWTGSFSATDNQDSQNVYILTLPAFRWIRVSASTAPRAGSSCQIVNSQMISVGGWDPTGTSSYSNRTVPSIVGQSSSKSSFYHQLSYNRNSSTFNAY